jgi:RNA polymerase sigma-B factor
MVERSRVNRQGERRVMTVAYEAPAGAREGRVRTGKAAPRPYGKEERAEEIRWLLQRYARTRDAHARERLVELHRGLVRLIASLIQVAYVGLLDALDRFDPDRGVRFTTFATQTIVGVLRHHQRDEGWMVRTPRGLRDLALKTAAARLALERRLGRAATLPELAMELEVDEERLIEAMEAFHLRQPISLEPACSPADEGAGYALADVVGRLDPEIQGVENRLWLGGALAQLPRRERVILYLRFYRDATQAEVARRIGISQMQVSRLERRALRALRRLLEEDGREARPVP